MEAAGACLSGCMRFVRGMMRISSHPPPISTDLHRSLQILQIVIPPKSFELLNNFNVPISRYFASLPLAAATLQQPVLQVLAESFSAGYLLRHRRYRPHIGQPYQVCCTNRGTVYRTRRRTATIAVFPAVCQASHEASLAFAAFQQSASERMPVRPAICAIFLIHYQCL